MSAVIARTVPGSEPSSLRSTTVAPSDKSRAADPDNVFAKDALSPSNAAELRARFVKRQAVPARRH